MAIPNHFLQGPGGYYDTRDGSGPYAIGSDGEAVLIGSSAAPEPAPDPAARSASLTRVSEAGEVPAGARMISVKNLGSGDAVVAGGQLPPGETVTWIDAAGGLGAVEYGAGTLLIAVTR